MTSPSFVIGIAGGTGAGKTTVAELVAGSVGDSVVHVPLDNYYRDFGHLDPDERAAIDYDHPDAFEWSLLREHLETLLSGQAVEMPQYDFERHRRRDETERVEPAEVVFFEGILALYDETLREMMDLRLYVETDADVRILRRIRRDVVERGRDLEGVIEQYLETVKPAHEQFVAPTKREADLIIPMGANPVAVTLLAERIEAEVRGEATRDWERDDAEPYRVDPDAGG